MIRYVFKRILFMVPILFGITIITFTIMHLAPGGPVESQTELNIKASLEARENLKKIYGLDKPLHIQYINWLERSIKLDFGESFVDGRPVIEKIKERIPVTLSINILSLILIFMIALPMGVLSAWKRNSIFDRIATLFVFTGFSMPHFWLALLLMILFGVELGWLPISGIQSIETEGMTFSQKVLDILKHLILPVCVAAVGGIAGLSRYARTSMLEVLRQDYIRTAVAKGVSQRKVLLGHALRNALMPVVTILGLSIPGLIGGSVIFESIFAIPGMGQLYYSSAMSRDYPVVMGILVIIAILTLLGNLIADITYAIVDPRVRLGRQR